MAQITIDVPDGAAEVLKDDGRRKAVSAIVALMLRSGGDGAKPFLAQLDEVQRAARGSGLADAEVEAELAAYNAERRD